ncbi:MAG: protein-disulfide reductase DsbD domain-containing protein, partial [Gammaproteobacteria bacterium]
MSDPVRSVGRVLAWALCRLSLVATVALAGSSLAWSADTAKRADVPAPAGINAILGANRSSGEEEFLPPDQAFQLAAFADGPNQVRLQWVIHEGYYLYKSRIKVASNGTQAKLGTPALPQGKRKHDEYFGDQEVYHDEVIATVPVTRSGTGALELPVDVTYQGCADAGLCYPPITKNLTVSLVSASGAPAAGANPGAGTGAASSNGAPAPSASASTASAAGFVSEQDRLAALIRDGNLAAVLGTFFGIGLLLSFTPCVLPMIPILSGIIVGQGGKVTPGRGFSLAFTYVQGMAL